MMDSEVQTFCDSWYYYFEGNYLGKKIIMS